MEKHSITTGSNKHLKHSFMKNASLIKGITLCLLFSFTTATNAFGQTATQTSIENTNVGTNVTINSYTWRVAQKITHTDGYKYALLYGMTNFYNGRFGATNVYNNSEVRTAFTNRYAKDSEYTELRKIAVSATLNNGANFDNNARTVLPTNPQLASATGTTVDVIFLPSWQDVRDWGNINLAATFPLNTGRLITRNYAASPHPVNNMIGFLTTDSKTLQDDAGIAATVSSSALHFRPCIWVRLSPIEPTIDPISVSPAAVCSGGNLTLSPPTVNTNGATITSQGWEIETSAGSFTGITLPHQVSYSDNGKKLRYFVTYSGGTIYSNEVTITVNPVPVLSQPANLTYCVGASVSAISFSGTNVSSVSWQIISGTGSSIGLSANSGTGNISGFTATNITTSPISITIEVTPISAAGCTGTAKTFTLKVNPAATANNIITRDTTIYSGKGVNLNDLAEAQSIANPVFKWYNSLFDNTPITPPVVYPDTGTHYYFVSVEGDNICEGDWDTRKLVTVNVISSPTPPMEDYIDVCEGSTVTFTATPTNGGSSPAFQWKKNNVNIPNATDSTYSYIPQNGDTISCELTSNEQCASPTAVVSVNIVIKVNPLPVLTQPDSLVFRHGDSVSLAAFAGTNLGMIVWETASDLGTAIGMNANNGIGNISDFIAGNTTNAPITAVITATPVSLQGCVGESKIFTITVNPKQLFGTVFPFVQNTRLNGETDTAYKLFAVTARLYAVPATNSTNDPMGEILKTAPLFETVATLYDGSVWHEGIPKYPGEIAKTNNPGVAIHWNELFPASSIQPVDSTYLPKGETPEKPIGIYTFEDVPDGDYILVLSRNGYVMRFAEVSMNAQTEFLGHRELVPGDMTRNLQVDNADVSGTKSNFAPLNNSKYKPKYDLNADKQIDETDLSVNIRPVGFGVLHYSDTRSWILKYKINE